ncbi:MAG TPA: urease accessory protein UreE [Oscillatoriales cyanobacterium M59_W2019_021]|nr:urease accessory protein UreE [Oscillatoriales cyanobacterium M4454_W2019_049]HIK49381.1 urease accessory protein UreE [Oscillatoriales cyanobacterium M59_W2019_021]
MLTVTQRLSETPTREPPYILWLTAEERTRSRRRFETAEGEAVSLQLPRGTILCDRDILAAETGDVLVRVQAKPEPVLTVTADDVFLLMRSAYHLGNRHVPLEITPTYLRLSPDPVLQKMLVQLGVEVREEIAPFHPEIGAYSHVHHV